ncbi:hypothetical protein [Enterobacter hormaechei]|uniref:hypothetical protein n=1 Tax=Enterobacter hormaechei TaxID=158836 RepID=UPI0039C36FA2
MHLETKFWSRPMSNIDKRATELLIENGVLVADTLRHLADNEIDSDYFAICHTNENGTEIECELAITDYARQAAGTVDELVKALEAAEKRIAELEAREVVLPQRYSMLHRVDFDEPYHTEMVYKQHQVLKALHDAGVNAAAAGKGEAS